jgi:hypothetical protein
MIRLMSCEMSALKAKVSSAGAAMVAGSLGVEEALVFCGKAKEREATCCVRSFTTPSGEGERAINQAQNSRCA